MLVFVNGAAIDLCIGVVGSMGGCAGGWISAQWHRGLRTMTMRGDLALVEPADEDQKLRWPCTVTEQSSQWRRKAGPSHWLRGFHQVSA